jgi:hypothetical protein
MMSDGRSVPDRRFKGVFMKSAVLAAVAFASLTCVVSPASALVLLDQHDAIVSESTPVAISFYAGATSTSVSFAGYDVPSAEYLDEISLRLNGAGPNLLDGTYSYTPAIDGSSSSQLGNSLSFGGVAAGSYDDYAAVAATSVGSYYTLSYDFSELFQNDDGYAQTPNALMITASDASMSLGVSTVPEPATWAMLIFGFAMIGTTLRKSDRNRAARSHRRFAIRA